MNSNEDFTLTVIVGGILVAFATFLLTALYYEQGDLSILTRYTKVIIGHLKESGYIPSIFGGFFGAAGGAGIVYLLDSKKQSKKDLAYLNRAIALTGAVISTLLNLKRDYAIPKHEELYKLYDVWNTADMLSRRTGLASCIELEGNHILKRITTPFIPIKDLLNTITVYSQSGPRTFMLTYQLKSSIERLVNMIELTNLRIEKIEDDSRKAEIKLPIYLGLEETEGKTDQILADYIRYIYEEIDTGLCLALKTQDLLKDIGLGKKKLPNKVVELSFINGAEAYLPPKEYCRKFEHE